MMRKVIITQHPKFHINREKNRKEIVLSKMNSGSHPGTYRTPMEEKCSINVQ